MDWILIVAGLILVLSPINMRYHQRKARQRITRRKGDIERFDRFLVDSRLTRTLYVLPPILGIACIAVGLVNA